MLGIRGLYNALTLGEFKRSISDMGVSYKIYGTFNI